MTVIRKEQFYKINGYLYELLLSLINCYQQKDVSIEKISYFTGLIHSQLDKIEILPEVTININSREK